MIHFGMICVQIEDRRGGLMQNIALNGILPPLGRAVPRGLVNDGGGLRQVSYTSIIPYSAC
jgi:hypothetical protein